jgi:hypothetical protein
VGVYFDVNSHPLVVSHGELIKVLNWGAVKHTCNKNFCIEVLQGVWTLFKWSPAKCILGFKFCFAYHYLAFYLTAYNLSMSTMW